LFNQLEVLSQLDLFHGLDDRKLRTIADLKAAIARTTRELREAEAA
jgi:hypothetical protein